MKRAKGLSLILSAVLLTSVLTGCGSTQSMATADSVTAEAYSAENQAGDYGFAELDSAEETGGQTQYPADVKLIYTGDVTLEATDLDAALEGVSELVNGFDGYFERQEIYRESFYKSVSCTVRVPGDQFDAFLTSVGTCAGCRVTYQFTSTENVGEQYADLESRLETLQIKLERLQTLLSQAENMDDIITIESAISDTESELNQLGGEKNHYDSLIGYSTVYITLHEVDTLSEGVNPSFAQRLSAGFSGGLKSFGAGCANLLVWLVSNLIGIAIFLAVAAAVLITVIRLRRRRRKTNGQLPSDAPQE